MSLFDLWRQGPEPLRVDPLVAALQAQIASLEADVRYERERNADLLDRFTALRVAGAVPEPQTIMVTPTPTLDYVAPQADELRELIGAKAGSNLKLRGIMLRQLAADRAAGLNDEQIEARINAGVESAGVPA